MKTLQQFINKTKGTEVSVPWGFKGECVSLVQMYLNECCDVPLARRGNANVYCQNIVNSGYGKYVDTPQRGDIINYDTPNDWNPYGHVAIVVSPDEIYHQWAGHGARFGSINQNQKRLYVVRPNKILVENEPVDKIAKDVINGKYGNGDERKRKLEALGYDYNEVQAKVNELLYGNKKSIDELAKEVLDGKWGNGNDRKQRLESSGYDYDKVQAKVNELVAPKMSARDFALEVWHKGSYGNGEERRKNAERLGVDYNEAQRLINILANGGKI